MLRLSVSIIILLYSCLSLSKNYQIDLIVFAHRQSDYANNKLLMDYPLLPSKSNAISLKTDSTKAYTLLPSSQSSLRNEYYLLNRSSKYQILGHYSWRQPSTNQSSIALPLLNHNGWQMQGTVRVRQSNYYLFNAELQLSPPDKPQSSFTLSQKQRLKNGLVYFLDHPEIGMIIKIT